MFTSFMDLSRILLIACLTAIFSPASSSQAAKGQGVYIGTYTGARSQGIYYSQFDPKTGVLSAPELAAATKNPSFLAIDPSRKFLFAVNEISNFSGKGTGAASAFVIDHDSGKLTLLNQCRTGDGPCHLSVSREKDATRLLVANYGEGSVEVLAIQPDGRLVESRSNEITERNSQKPAAFIQHHGSSVNPQRQSGPHAHFILPDPKSRFALVCDLGLDKVIAYPFDTKTGLLDAGNAVSLSLPPGSGPRHLAFHPSGKFAYVINEMASTLTACKYDNRSGKLEIIGALSTLPNNFKGQSTCAEVQMHPSGKFVYASNRGDDSIAIFAIDRQNGALSLVDRQATHGKTPRHFALSPGGKWLLCGNQDSDNISVFRVDAESGRLTFDENRVEVGAPVCIQFVDAP